MMLLVPSPSGRPCQLAGAAGLWQTLVKPGPAPTLLPSSLHAPLFLWASCWDQETKQLSTRWYLRDDALLVLLLFPHHGVGFSSTRLPISEDADIIAFKGMLQHFFANVSVHLLLRCIVDVCRLHRGGRHGEALQRGSPASPSPALQAGSGPLLLTVVWDQ